MSKILDNFIVQWHKNNKAKETFLPVTGNTKYGSGWKKFLIKICMSLKAYHCTKPFSKCINN